MEPTALRNTAPPRREGVFFGYVAVVCVSGLAVFAPQVPGLPDFLRSAPAAFWLMGALAVLLDVSPLRPPGPRQTSPVFPSICFTFATLLVWGLGPAVLVQTVAVAAASARMRYRPWRAAFNAGQYAVAFGAAALVLRLAEAEPLARVNRPGWTAAMIALAAGVTWFVVNYALVSWAVWLRFEGSFWSLLSHTAGYETLSTGALLLLGPVLVGAVDLSPALIPFVLVPLYAVNQMARLYTAHNRLATRDSLTGLANRERLMAEVDEQVGAHEAAAEDPGSPVFALLLLDIDRFKHVNDALGHGVGDRLLVHVGRRLSATVRPEDLVARLGGDEFAIVAPGLSGAGEARALAERIAAVLDDPVALDGLPLDVGGSIGVAVYPRHGDDFATLMRHADVAMYDAKTRGDVVAVYTPESDHNSPQRLGLLADLRRALETPGAEEIAFYYQPQVELRTGDVIGVEALLRWHHPQRGMVDPEELIRVAEQSAVMRLLTLRVVDDVVAQLAKWEADGLSLRAAINVSVRDLHTGEIVDRLADRLRHHGIGPDQVQLEITEGALMADPRRVLATLRRLDRLGVALSLDDFGTGYSSMQHLRRLPLSEVKIDRSFVLGMAEDSDDEAIVRSIIELSGALGLRVVAEGVEDERTYRLLARMGCDVAQGWYYARPMPADQLAFWLSRYRPPQRLLAGWPSSGMTPGARRGGMGK
ncbi:putative bifunctional diguanylate cyclase/phosphodiesterase [Rugosimonospora africana]|uniref:GGDEF-domain containing protein n=1 Tax=Rugosimonospora africana TaxID=556532 RepID=A0A8J3QM27_9ACTN|nr:EAL domain-containing protein [Rugosimonospora africana]GIH13530.1 GGDEF-domain containing protein [Rugosimonospora africana]